MLVQCLPADLPVGGNQNERCKGVGYRVSTVARSKNWGSLLEVQQGMQHSGP